VIRFLCACLLSMVCVCAHAQRVAPMPDGVSVPSWNQLDPQRQAVLQPFADRWDRMPASRRVRILERYERWQHLPPEQREAMRDGLANYRHMSPEQRQKIRESMHVIRALPPDRQQALRQRWRSMTPEQRKAWLDAGGPGIAPPPSE
jgi:TRAP-type C4-dicarboxylate transport system substrate-binding protein